VNEFDAKRNEAEYLDEMLDFQSQVIPLSAGQKGVFDVCLLQRRLIYRRLYFFMGVGFSTVQTLDGLIQFRMNKSLVGQLPFSNNQNNKFFSFALSTSFTATNAVYDGMFVNEPGADRYYIAPFRMVIEADSVQVLVENNATTGAVDLFVGVVSQRSII
jgi:hypothetical protein